MKREIKIGIFAIVVVCCSWAGIRFLSGIDVFGRSVDYYAQYDTISGISSASPIMINGVKVGMVTDIAFDPTLSDKVTLTLSIKRRYEIPSNSYAKIYSPGLMSSMAVGITLGDSSQPLCSGDSIEVVEQDNLMDVATEKVLALVDQITIISGELTHTLESVNALLAESSDHINSTIASVSSVAHNLDELLTTQQQNLETAIGGVALFADSLGDSSQDVSTLLSNLSELSDQLANANIGSSLETTLAKLGSTLDAITSTDGSVGRLLSDEQLYQNLAAVSGSLNELLLDMQSNPKRYVHFSLFGSKGN